jgi:Uma2 family endonuclease
LSNRLGLPPKGDSVIGGRCSTPGSLSREIRRSPSLGGFLDTARTLARFPKRKYNSGMANAAARPRMLYDALCELPPNKVGEIVDGELYTSPRPAAPHTRVASQLGGELSGPFDRGRGGPGGWIILDEPELQLHGQVLVPDLAGWRRTRMPFVPDAPAFELAPDWVCEVLSPSTSTLDRTRKLPVYAREGVEYAWLLEPLQRTLEVFKLQGQQWITVGTWDGDAKVRAEPFDAIELALADLWADIGPREV